MNKKVLALCILAVTAFNLCACNVNTGMAASQNRNQDSANVSENVGFSSETEDNNQQIVSVEEIVESAQGDDVQGKIPMIGGADYAFSRKYVDDVYDIYLAGQIVGQEACDEWVNNVFLVKAPEEQIEIPPLYQMIHDLNISKEDFLTKNAEFIDSPDMYFSEDIISALYLNDIDEMKEKLINPLALYYDGEIYTFDELSKSQNSHMVTGIPADVMNNYLEYIEAVCEENGIIKYMQEDIDNVRNTSENR